MEPKHLRSLPLAEASKRYRQIDRFLANRRPFPLLLKLVCITWLRQWWQLKSALRQHDSAKANSTPFRENILELIKRLQFRFWVTLVGNLLVLVIVVEGLLFYSVSTSVPPACRNLAVQTFTVEEEEIEAGAVYTSTLTTELSPQLFVRPNIVTEPAGCNSELSLQWVASGENGDRHLENYDDFIQIGYIAPPVNQEEILRVSIQDSLSGRGVNAFLIFISINQEN